MTSESTSATPAIVLAVIVLFVLLGGVGLLLGLIKWFLVVAAVVVIVGGLLWNWLSED